jgi:hypothetical protein
MLSGLPPIADIARARDRQRPALLARFYSRIPDDLRPLGDVSLDRRSGRRCDPLDQFPSSRRFELSGRDRQVTISIESLAPKNEKEPQSVDVGRDQGSRIGSVVSLVSRRPTQQYKYLSRRRP